MAWSAGGSGCSADGRAGKLNAVIEETDVERVAAAASELPPAGASSANEDYLTSLFVTVLDYQLRTVVVTRALEHFRAQRSRTIRTLKDLERAMRRFADDEDGNVELALHLWGYRLWTRAAQLRALAAYFRSIGVVDEASLRAWAHGSEFRADFEGRVKGLGRAVYESLVMRQGVDTVKPDVHVRRFAEAAAGRTLDNGDLVELVSRAAARLGLTAQELDLRIWNAAVRPPAS
jgi:hypothetical protein